MCTAPQNIFVSERGVNTTDGIVSYEDFCDGLANAITNLVENPRAGAGTAGAIQNPDTLKRIEEFSAGRVILKSRSIENAEFTEAVTATPMLIALTSVDKPVFSNECFGPIGFIIKTKDIDESLGLASELAGKKGAITCLAYSTNDEMVKKIRIQMNNAFVPVSFNFTGAGFVNQHAAFSDFHVTGGNPAGNATFTNADYINRRFVWLGNRYMG
jgi:acyl-CoA reductase-like NAD-dependent aldehyde dehydrogenase